MAEQIISSSPEEWRNFNTNIPIAACRLSLKDLKDLYKILSEKQKEYRDRLLRTLSKLDEETSEAFDARYKKVKDAFIVSVTIAGQNEEVVSGNDESFFDATNIPSLIRSVFYSTQSVPGAILNHSPADRITVFLDFSQRPLLDFRQLPTLPTPNDSNFSIAANNESWFASTKSKLVVFFKERQTGTDWLHRSAVYDILLFFIGMPWAIFNDYRFTGFFESRQLPTVLNVAIYVYIFFISLTLFRIMFSYSRWVFPKIECESKVSSSPLRHRGVWALIFVAVIGPPAYDLFKFLTFG